ncbi:ABC transporter ATP-binding protein [Streptoalloteichus hindustanus]|uniref:ATP-binding cassette, subfamily B/ATP-binding cassette, subfamily C n=1 Tax=Streptoalloteichus hindustanus TaxID=2017 RepID=A0A1M5D5J1_STRHI|nr:ABC transporter ATP-binding protein [Streptoalloteichus hindustanus]SHF62258.1 ATP-binding cassette, subfamily B/ATP-binding cassette, subfamily C [Streptoalloteichus hindustanus]
MLNTVSPARAREDVEDPQESTPEDEPKQRVNWRDLVRVTRGHRGAISAALGLTLVGGAMGLAQPLLATRTIDEFSHNRPYQMLVSLLAAVFVAEALITAVGHYLLERTGEGVVLGVRLRVVDRLLRWPMRRYQQHRLGDLLTRTTSDTTLLRDSLAYDLVEASVGVFIIIGGIATMIWLDATMFLIVAAIVGTIGGLTTLLLKGIRSSVEDAQDSLGAMSAELERALSAIRTVRVMRAEGRERDRIGRLAREAYANSLQAAKRNAVINPAMTLATHGAMITVLVVGGMRVASGGTSLAELVGFLLYVTYIATPLSNLFDVFATLQRGLAALQRVEDVARIPVEDEEITRPVTTSPRAPERPVTADTPAIEFRGVGFAYEPERPVLRDVSFSIPRNSHVALVGPSGAGKSTIFALIARFYDPRTGHILLDGRDTAHEMTVEECRASISLVEQSAPVMHGTLRENITYAKPEATDAEIARAVELASLEGLVQRLPEGLDTPVGEHGSALSGGEQQRVAIARALLPRPRLLLMDEPTSHLDAANEAVLTRTIEHISAECTLLVIAHRPSTIRAADRIVVLDHGRVEAVGSYPEVAHLLGEGHGLT